MKVIFLNGSPKVNNSTSEYLLKGLEVRLTECDVKWYNSCNCNVLNLSEDIESSAALVIAFPLYVDSIPSHVLRIFTELQSRLTTRCSTKVYVIVNSGFYEASQSRNALDMARLWCEASGLSWGQGIAVGGGGMVQSGVIGKIPLESIGKAFDSCVGNITELKEGDIILVEPEFPRFLYKIAAHMGWRGQAKKNGLKLKDLHRKVGV